MSKEVGADQKLNVVHKQVRRDVHYGQDGQPEQDGYHDRHDHHGRHGRHGHQGHHIISIRVCVFIKWGLAEKSKKFRCYCFIVGISLRLGATFD